jgi:divalent metal cation (Fe/Co/Zn/Cd) transporter
MDVSIYSVFVEDSAALIGVVLAVLGVAGSQALKLPWLDPAASVAIGLVLIGAAALLARKSVSLLVGESMDPEQIALVRQVIASDPAVERVGHLLTMRMGSDSVLLTAAVRFERHLDLDQVEQAIERLELAIKQVDPTIQQLFLESGALKQAARSAGTVGMTECDLSASSTPARWSRLPP